MGVACTGVARIGVAHIGVACIGVVCGVWHGLSRFDPALCPAQTTAAQRRLEDRGAEVERAGAQAAERERQLRALGDRLAEAEQRGREAARLAGVLEATQAELKGQATALGAVQAELRAREQEAAASTAALAQQRRAGWLGRSRGFAHYQNFPELLRAEFSNYFEYSRFYFLPPILSVQNSPRCLTFG